MTSKKTWDDTNNIYRFRNTLLEYLDNRECDIGDYKNFSYTELVEMCKCKELDFIVGKKKGNKKIFIKHLLTSSLPNIMNLVTEIYDIEKILDAKNEDEIIFVITGKISKNMKQFKNKLFNTKNIFITFYNYKNHIYNILNHSYVPKHIILKKKEKEEILEKFNITKNKELPEIDVYDPIAIRIGLRPGDICKIYRDTTTSIISKYYRYCS